MRCLLIYAWSSGELPLINSTSLVIFRIICKRRNLYILKIIYFILRDWIACFNRCSSGNLISLGLAMSREVSSGLSRCVVIYIPHWCFYIEMRSINKRLIKKKKDLSTNDKLIFSQLQNFWDILFWHIVCLSLLYPSFLFEFLTDFFYYLCASFLADVVNNILKTKEFFTVPVTTAEFAVMKTACSVWPNTELYPLYLFF